MLRVFQVFRIFRQVATFVSVRRKAVNKIQTWHINTLQKLGIHRHQTLPRHTNATNMTSSIKPKVCNAPQLCRMSTEPRPQGICTQNLMKIGPTVPKICSWTQTNCSQYSAPVLPGRRKNITTATDSVTDLFSVHCKFLRNSWEFQKWIFTGPHLLPHVQQCQRNTTKIQKMNKNLQLAEHLNSPKISL